MINIIWQTARAQNTVLSCPTIGQFEYIDKVIFKDIEHTHHFDDNSYQTILENSVIVYSAPLHDVDPRLKEYLEKYKSLNIKYILLHLSNESLDHKFEYYLDAEHVFRFHYDKKIVYPNVTTLPLGYTTGYHNNGDINLSDKRDISSVFIGQPKNDRFQAINIVRSNKGYLHLIDKWSSPKSLSFNDVINIYKRTRFVPCPMGNISPETLRLYECLEWGCIPVVKLYNGEDYYSYIFGEHPLPVVNEWKEMQWLMDSLKDVDDLILLINEWYKNMLNKTAKNVASICKGIYEI